MTTPPPPGRSRLIGLLAGLALAAFTLAATTTDAGSAGNRVKHGASGQVYAWQVGSC